MTSDGRPHLSRAVIAQTALTLTDRDGLSGLSMRKLGSALGVEAMSLYHYVANKDDLLDAVLDLLYAEIDLPLDIANDAWEEAIRTGLASFRQVLLRHPAALELFASRPPPTLDAVQVLYWSYQRFEAVGLSQDDSLHAFRFAVSFVMGNAANEIGMLSRSEDEEPDLSVIPDPAVQSFFAKSQEVSEDSYYDVGIETVVAGLRAKFNLP